MKVFTFLLLISKLWHRQALYGQYLHCKNTTANWTECSIFYDNHFVKNTLKSEGISAPGTKLQHIFISIIFRSWMDDNLQVRWFPLVSRQQFPYKNMGHNTSPWSITAVAFVDSKAHSCHFSVLYCHIEYVPEWCIRFMLHMIAPVPVKWPWSIWVNKLNDIIWN